MKFVNDLAAFEKVFSDVEFDVLSEKMREFIRAAFQRIPFSDRRIILEWVEEVQKVKSDPNLSREEKVQRLESLEAGRVVGQFLKSIAQSIVDRIPNQQRSYLQTGLSGLGIWAAAAKPEFAIFAFIAFQKLLPKFLLTEKGDSFLLGIREWLHEDPVEIR